MTAPATAAPPRGVVGPAAVAARTALDPPWLAQRREAAWELFTRLPLPSAQRDEDWRRTDLGRLPIEELVCDPGTTDHGEALVAHLRMLRDRLDPHAGLVAATRNGVRHVDNLDMLTAQGIFVGSLAEAVHSHADLVRRALDVVAPVDSIDTHGDAPFLALWHALWRGGVFVHVPAGVSAAVPVVAAHSAAGDSAAIFPATVAVLDEGASLTLVELMASPAGDAMLLSDAVTAIVVGESARLSHCVLQQWGSGARHVALSRAVLGRDAVLRSFVATVGAGMQKAWIEVVLDGEGSDAGIAGVVAGAGRQHLDHQSLQAHRAPRTRSDLQLKVAVRDTARSVYGGLIDVDRAAQQTDAYVQNRNLLLSHGARATGIPRLEIRADDVRCSHGVTAGHVDDDERFYLMARGISADDAERLIVRGFMQDAVDRCPHPGFAELVGTLLDETAAGRSVAGVAEEASRA